jgi:hypothetical protein
MVVPIKSSIVQRRCAVSSLLLVRTNGLYYLLGYGTERWHQHQPKLHNTITTKSKKELLLARVLIIEELILDFIF